MFYNQRLNRTDFVFRVMDSFSSRRLAAKPLYSEWSYVVFTRDRDSLHLNMSEKELIKQIRKLPSKAQQEAADFVEFLSKKYIQQPKDISSSQEKSILESPFRGMWKDREDMQDSTKWVRELRKSRWAK